jgi:hypothetical protein
MEFRGKVFSDDEGAALRDLDLAIHRLRVCISHQYGYSGFSALRDIDHDRGSIMATHGTDGGVDLDDLDALPPVMNEGMPFVQEKLARLFTQGQGVEGGEGVKADEGASQDLDFGASRFRNPDPVAFPHRGID